MTTKRSDAGTPAGAIRENAKPKRPKIVTRQVTQQPVTQPVKAALAKIAETYRVGGIGGNKSKPSTKPPTKSQAAVRSLSADELDLTPEEHAVAGGKYQPVKSAAALFGAQLARAHLTKHAAPPGMPVPPAASPTVLPNKPATPGSPGGLGKPPGLMAPGRSNVVSGQALGGATMASPAATAGLRGPGPKALPAGGAARPAQSARPTQPAQSAFSRLPQEAQQRYQGYAQRMQASGQKPMDEATAAAYYSRNYMGGQNYQDKVIRKDDPTQGRAAVVAQQQAQGRQKLQARATENAANLERMPANTNRFMSNRTYGQLLQGNMASNAAKPAKVRPGSPQAPMIATPPVAPRPNPRQTPGPRQLGQQLAMA